MPLCRKGVSAVCCLVAIESFPFSLFILLHAYQPFKVQWFLTKATPKSLDTAEKNQTSSVP